MLKPSFLGLIFFSVLGSGRDGCAFTLSSSNDPSLQGWANHTVTFALNPTGCPAGIVRSLTDAMAVWNGVANSDLSVSLGGVSSAGYAQFSAGLSPDAALIFCDSNFAADAGPAGRGRLAMGHVTPPPPGGHVAAAYVMINVDPGSTENAFNADPTKLEIALARELGRALGLGPSADVNALMYGSIAAKTQLRLGQDDLDGIAYLYPRNDARQAGCGRVAGPGSAWGLGLLVMMIPIVVVGGLRRTRFHGLVIGRR